MGGACICLLMQEAMLLSSGYRTSIAVIVTLWVGDGTLDEHHDRVAALTQSIKA